MKAARTVHKLTLALIAIYAVEQENAKHIQASSYLRLCREIKTLFNDDGISPRSTMMLDDIVCLAIDITKPKHQGEVQLRLPFVITPAR